MRRLTSAFTVFVAVLAVLLPAQAMAVNPEQTVGGAGSKWFSGSLLQQSGLNCSTAIIGNSYSETMVSAIAGFGGTANIPKVGDTYYASLLVSIPGNPCGSGSSLVGTDLVLPRGTTVDTSKPIRCFGQSRTATTFGELTGGTWGPFLGSTGQYCPASVGGSLTGTSGAVGVGFRPLANGQLYELFVPIKSTQNLIGAAHNPTDEIKWVLSTSGTYSQTGSTSVWTTVVPAGTPSGPFIYFARNPSVQPFWNTDPALGDNQRNQVEWFANLYSAGQPGTLCWDLYPGPTATGTPEQTCTSPGVNWNSAVTNLSDTWQVTGGGPNGGYVPFAYGPNETYTIRWRFQPNVGPLVTNTISFTTLPGPDTDADGTPDPSDACPAVKGTLPNGCPQAGAAEDPDGDGLLGTNDKCPNDNGGASLDGCPVKSADQGPAPVDQTQQQQVKPPDQQQTNPPALTLTGSLGAIKGNKIKRSALAKGYPISVKCGQDSDVAATLTVSSSVAKKLKLKVKKGQKSLSIGSAKGKCTAAKGGTLKLKLASSAASKVKKSKKGFSASLGLEFTRAGTAPVKISKSLKLT